MMIDNTVGLHTGHATMTQNIIADLISCIKKETDSMRHFLKIQQEYPELASCKRFHPSAELISSITDAILYQKYVDPLEAARMLRKTPGQIIS